jgi:hypothetical protein
MTATINSIMICWSVKGGSGTSAVAAALAMLSPTAGKNPLLVDLCGDSATLVGIDPVSGVGLSDWFASHADPQVLDTLCVHTKSGIDLLPTSARIAPGERRWGEFVEWLIDQSDQRVVVLDCGTHLPRVNGAQSFLVMRPCYLAVHRAMTLGLRPTGIVLVRELDRSLTNADVEAAIGAPIVAEIPLDPMIARSVDAGLANVRLPRSFARPLRKLIREMTLLNLEGRSRVA